MSTFPPLHNRSRVVARWFAVLLWLGTSWTAMPATGQPVGWLYSAAVRVSPATTIADYQLRLVLSPATFEYTKAKADGSDLRVYAGSAALSYWIENWNPIGVSTLWVKVPAFGTSSLRLYYGNAAATAVSSGTATFDLFDDFDSLAAWTVLNRNGTGTAVTATVDGKSVARLTSQDGVNAILITRPFASNSATGHVVETRAQAGSLNDGYLVGFTDGSLYPAVYDLPGNGYVSYAFRQGNSQSGVIAMVDQGGPGSGDWSLPDSGSSGQWNIGGLRWSGSNLNNERNRQNLITGSSTAFASLSHIHLSNLSSVWNFDWLLVRKHPQVESVATFDGAVAEYAAEGNAVDSTGSHHATANAGVSYGEGVSGKAFQFNGSSGVATVPAFDMGNSWTIETWVRPDGCSDSTHCPVIARSAGNQDGLVLAYLTAAHGTARQFSLNFGGGTWQMLMASGGSYAMGMWHHVLVTRDGDTYTMFVDGEQRAQQVVAGISSVYQSRDFQFGHWNYSVGESYLRGALDETRIYNRALSLGEVETRHRDGLGRIALPWRDEFNGKLRPVWTRTNESALTIGAQATALRLTTTATDLYGGGNNLVNLTTMRLPDVVSDYVMTARVSAPVAPAEPYQQAGIALFADNAGAPDMDNYIRQMHVFESGARFEITRDINGVPNADLPNGPLTTVPGNTPFWLRFARTAGALEAGYSLNGFDFVKFSTSTAQAFVAMQGQPMKHVGLFALHSVPTATPIAFDFDYVEVAKTCSNLPSGLVSWWPAEGNAQDALGLNHGNAVSGVSYAPGKFGQSFNLDGNTGFVQVSNPDSLPVGAAPRTMMLWFKTPTNFYSTTEWALMQYGGGNGTGSMFGLVTSLNAPGKLYFFGYDSDLAGATTLQPDTWYHAAVSYDGATVRLYLNGQFDGQAAYGLNTQFTSDGLTIGHRPGSAFWKGELDDVAIFSRALSEIEIAAVYASASQSCLQATPTTTAITSHAPEPSVVGTPISVQVAVTVTPPNTGTPGGMVVVSDGVDSCTVTLPANSCALRPTNTGVRSITATYSGNADFGASASTPVAHTVVAASEQSTLTVTRDGSGSGNVTSGDGLIQCGAVCFHLYPNGSTVTMTATADAGSNFTGWLGACTGTGSCQIVIAANNTASATFAPQALTPYIIDVDVNYAYEAAFDGVLVARYLFGISGTALTNNALGANPERTDPAQIVSYLNNIRPLLDFDGNGRTDALTDGLLLVRYLAGLRDDALINGAVGSGATRTLAADIASAIATLVR